MKKTRLSRFVLILTVGLAPFSVHAFWVIGISVHQNITHQALFDISIQVKNGVFASFSGPASSEIQRHNKRTDKNQSPEKHFDDERLGDSSLRLITLRKEILLELVHESYFPLLEDSAAGVDRETRAYKARLLLGEALHTLQDFYSHTNWVEKYGASQSGGGTDLLKSFGKKIIGKNTNNICSMLIIGSLPLTSGWAPPPPGSLPQLIACIRPLGKCPHGFRNPCPIVTDLFGLNKDDPLKDEPFGSNHTIAKSLAIQATNVFVTGIIEDVMKESSKHKRLNSLVGPVGAAQAGRSAVCYFMGESDPLDYCLEQRKLIVSKAGSGVVTGSFTDKINCGLSCEDDFPAGTKIALEAAADTGSEFSKWSDDSDACAGSTNPLCIFQLLEDTTVTAQFASRTLAVTKEGTGFGSVVSDPEGINCGFDCQEQLGSFVQDEPITLTATEKPGSEFKGWTSGCPGNTEERVCVVTLTATNQITMTAKFDSENTHELNLTVDGAGLGTVSSDPAGINCTYLAGCSSQSANFETGTPVTLTAALGPGSVFSGWSGACSGTESCVVDLSEDVMVSATFSLEDDPQFILNVSSSGSGTVTSNPTGINCGSDCAHLYPLGTPVVLFAQANDGAEFLGWGGACTGTEGCVVTMNSSRNVSATFTVAGHTLTVSREGAGSVSSSPTGIDCGLDCTHQYPFGTPVTLSAHTNDGAEFFGWGGACTGTGGCAVTMNSNQNVTATFTGLVISDVVFADANLQACVLSQYAESALVLSVTSLSCQFSGIANLNGLEEFTGLTTLYLDLNDIVDVSPLAELTQLVELGLSRTLIEIATVLSPLTQLTFLDLFNNINTLSCQQQVAIKAIFPFAVVDRFYNDPDDGSPLAVNCFP